jgi:hypothetical protein
MMQTHVIVFEPAVVRRRLYGGQYSSNYSLALQEKMTQFEFTRIVDDLNAIVNKYTKNSSVCQYMPFVIIAAGFIVFACTGLIIMQDNASSDNFAGFPVTVWLGIVLFLLGMFSIAVSQWRVMRRFRRCGDEIRNFVTGLNMHYQNQGLLFNCVACVQYHTTYVAGQPQQIRSQAVRAAVSLLPNIEIQFMSGSNVPVGLSIPIATAVAVPFQSEAGTSSHVPMARPLSTNSGSTTSTGAYLPLV